MATTRVTVDFDQHLPPDVVDSIKAEVHSYVWGYIQNKYGLKNDRGSVSVKLHQHDASNGACTACVPLATDGKH
jgi:hypothetical protein